MDRDTGLKGGSVLTTHTTCSTMNSVHMVNEMYREQGKTM